VNNDPQDVLIRWLRHEGAGALAEADGALSALLARLPEQAPSSAFEELVMDRLPWHPRAAAWRLGRRWQVALIGLLVVLGLTVAALPAALLALPVPVGSLISGLASLVAGAAEWTARGFSMWRFLAEVAEKVTLVLATPQVTLLVLGSMALGAAAFRFLYELTIEDRRSAHVETI